MKNKVLVIFVCLVFVASIGYFVMDSFISADNASKFTQLGADIGLVKNKETKEIVATVNGVDISKQRFEAAKLSYAHSAKKFSDNEILNILIQREVLFQEFAKRGITVDEAEVEKSNNERFDIARQDAEAWRILEDFASGLGMTMDEYIESCKDASRFVLLSSKFRDIVAKEYSDQINQESQELVSFDEYYENYINNLVDNSEIKIIEPIIP